MTESGALKCRCGCGAPPIGITALYRPGHDARHAGRVGRELRELGRVDDDLLAGLPTEALRAKALAMLTRDGKATTVKEPLTVKPEVPPVVDGRSTADLLAGYASIIAELRRRDVIRTNNAPAGDYAEWLVARALGGCLADNKAAKSYDLTLPDGNRVQVKSRVVSIPVQRGQLQASVFRSFDYEFAGLVLLRDIDYAVHRAVLTPRHVVEQFATRVDHVNGWRLMMTAAVLDHQESIDITAAMRAAARDA